MKHEHYGEKIEFSAEIGIGMECVYVSLNFTSTPLILQKLKSGVFSYNFSP